MKFFNQITGEHVIPADWQLQLKPGDYFIVEQPIMGIIGEQGAQQFDTSGIKIHVRIDKATRQPGFFLCTGFSTFCPGGEQGRQCIMDATRQITKEEFEQARKRDWK